MSEAEFVDRRLGGERSMRRVLDMQSHLDIALFGVGSPFADIPSHVYIGGYLEPEDYQTLSEHGVVGDVATVFFRADGSTDGIELNARATGPDCRPPRPT